jgi:hypothetical protein
VSYGPEWIGGAGLLGVSFLVAPPLAMLGFALGLLVAVALLLGLAGFVVATPFLFIRGRWRRSHRGLPAPTTRAPLRSAS